MLFRAFGVARKSFSGIDTGKSSSTGTYVCVREKDSTVCLAAMTLDDGEIVWKGACSCVCAHLCERADDHMG